MDVQNRARCLFLRWRIMFVTLKAQLSSPLREILILQTLHVAVALPSLFTLKIFQNGRCLIGSFDVVSFPYAPAVSIVNSI